MAINLSHEPLRLLAITLSHLAALPADVLSGLKEWGFADVRGQEWTAPLLRHARGLPPQQIKVDFRMAPAVDLILPDAPLLVMNGAVARFVVPSSRLGIWTSLLVEVPHVSVPLTYPGEEVPDAPSPKLHLHHLRADELTLPDALREALDRHGSTVEFIGRGVQESHAAPEEVKTCEPTGKSRTSPITRMKFIDLAGDWSPRSAASQLPKGILVITSRDGLNAEDVALLQEQMSRMVQHRQQQAQAGA